MEKKGRDICRLILNATRKVDPNLLNSARKFRRVMKILSESRQKARRRKE